MVENPQIEQIDTSERLVCNLGTLLNAGARVSDIHKEQLADDTLVDYKRIILTPEEVGKYSEEGCHAKDVVYGFACTRAKGHPGPHVAAAGPYYICCV